MILCLMSCPSPEGHAEGGELLKWVRRVPRGFLAPARPSFTRAKMSFSHGWKVQRSRYISARYKPTLWGSGSSHQISLLHITSFSFFSSSFLKLFPARLCLGHPAVFYGVKDTHRPAWTVKQANGFSFFFFK